MQLLGRLLLLERRLVAKRLSGNAIDAFGDPTFDLTVSLALAAVSAIILGAAHASQRQERSSVAKMYTTGTIQQEFTLATSGTQALTAVSRQSTTRIRAAIKVATLRATLSRQLCCARA